MSGNRVPATRPSSSNILNRRQVLRGAGSVAIALPLLSQLAPGRASAAGKTLQRFVTLYFGNGMPPAYSAPGFASPVLAPLAPHAAKIALIRGINNLAAPAGSGHPHARGSSDFAIGYANPSVDTAGGVSLDFAAYNAWKPTTALSSLSTEMWWWSQDFVRNTHSWQGVSRPNPGLTRPLAFFTQIFGSPMPAAPAGSPQAAAALKQQRYQISVLDSVLDGYKTVTGAASPYGPAVRTTLSNHFDSVRALERRVLALDMQASGMGPCATPTPPPDLSPQQTCSAGCDTKGSTGTHMAGGGVNKASNWDQVWPLLCDLFVQALRCDVTRIGSLTCTASGDRYTLSGQTTNVHDLAHAWRPGAENGFNVAVTYVMNYLAYFLKGMDDPAFVLPEGGTLLDNTPVLIGTEVSDPSTHSLMNLTFMIAGGGGLFKYGAYDFGGKNSEVDLYSTITHALGIGDKYGDPRYFTGYLTGLI
jgi:hypothetical protein